MQRVPRTYRAQVQVVALARPAPAMADDWAISAFAVALLAAALLALLV